MNTTTPGIERNGTAAPRPAPARERVRRKTAAGKRRAKARAARRELFKLLVFFARASEVAHDLSRGPWPTHFEIDADTRAEAEGMMHHAGQICNDLTLILGRLPDC